MRRREFIGAAVGTGLLYASAATRALSNSPDPIFTMEPRPASGLPPMAFGLLVKPARGPETTIARVKELGIPTCFFSLDDCISKFTKSLAKQLQGLLDKYGIVATAAEVVNPGPLKWNFMDGSSTIGIVPMATLAASIDPLKQTSDFAKLLGIPWVQTHCGFVPEDPGDPLYDEAVMAIRELAE